MRKAYRLLLIACLLTIAGVLAFLISWFAGQNQRGEIYQQLQAQVGHPDAVQSTPKTNANPAYTSPIDFAMLHAVNEDICAWLEIPETDIAYPVLQHPQDDSYYLEHTVEGAQGLPGSIYLQRADAKTFTDYHTVLYGHDMDDGTMFGSLKQYRDPDYLKSHRTIHLYLPDRQYLYQVFSAVVYDDRLLPAAFNDRVAADRQAFLESLRAVRDFNSHTLEDAAVAEDSHLLILSTCLGDDSSKRFLVTAVKVDEKA